MSVILILIAASLTVATGFLIAFLWSVHHGQFDDDVSPAVRILDQAKTPSENPQKPIPNQTDRL